MRLTSFIRTFVVVLCALTYSCNTNTPDSKSKAAGSDGNLSLGSVNVGSDDSCKFIYSAPPNSNESSFFSLQFDLQDIQIVSPSLLIEPIPKAAPILQAYFRMFPSAKMLVLYLWTTECSPCIKEVPHLKDFLATLTKKPQLKVIALSESSNQAAWSLFLQKKIFPAGVIENHVNENSSRGDDLCRTLYASPYRPLIVALDRSLNIRQALVYPFTEQRQAEFLAGVSRFTQEKKPLVTSLPFTKLSAASLNSEITARTTETQLLHYFVDSFIPRGSKNSSIKVLYLGDVRNDNQKKLETTIATLNQTTHSRPSKDPWIEAVSVSHPGIGLTLVVDHQHQIRLAMLGTLTEGQQIQIYEEISKLLRFYRSLENQAPLGASR